MERDASIMDKNISVINDLVISWHRVIADITPDHVKLLEEVKDSTEMFKWWREHIPNAQELKTFIDL